MNNQPKDRNGRRRVSPSHRNLFTADTCTFFSRPEQAAAEQEPPHTSEFVHRFVQRIGSNGVDTFLVNPNAQTVWYPSKALPTVLDGYSRGDREFFRGHAEGSKIPAEEVDQFLNDRVRFYNRYLDLAEAGVDWLAEASKACRRHRISPWLSVRMNDMHGANNPEGSYLNCDLFKQPELRLRGIKLNPARGTHPYWQALNYERPEVRAYFFSILRECVQEYDFEGLELDWLRNPNCCEPGAAQETIDLMADWIGEVRAMTESRARILGKPFPLGLRMPPSLGYFRHIGLDVAALVEEELIDFVSLSNFWQTTWDLPYDRFRARLGEEVTLFGVIEDAPNWIYGVIPHRARSEAAYNPGARYLSGSMELVRGNAAGKLAQGVDGVCTYNFHCTDELRMADMPAQYSALRDLHDLEMLRGAEKHYCLATPGGNAPFWDIPCQLPVVLEPGYRREFSLAMCREPLGADLQLWIQIIYEKRSEAPPLGVGLNGGLPKFAGRPAREFLFPTGPYTNLVDENESLIFEFDLSSIAEGWNSIVVYHDELDPRSLKGDAANAVRLLSIEIGIKKRRW